MCRNRRGRVVLVHRRLGALLMGGAMVVSATAATGAEEERRCRAVDAAAADAAPSSEVLEADECFTVRGRLSVHDSAPQLRLWPIGAKRTLGVAAGASGTELMPEGLREQVLWAAEEGQRVVGEFTVCPLPRAAAVVRGRSAGTRPLICVAAATGLRLEEADGNR